jgi:hypothetical protein
MPSDGRADAPVASTCCHPQTLRVSTWAEAKLDESSSQVLAG